MFIRKEYEFIIPVKNVSINELDFCEENFPTREMTEDVDEFKASIEKKILYIFYKIKDVSKLVSKDDLYSLYENIYKSILVAHINNVSCFKKIKNKDINGMNEQKALEVHLAKFKKIYDYHNNKFKCDENHIESQKTLKSQQLSTKFKSIDNEVNSLFRELTKKLEIMSENGILNIHLFILNLLINMLIKNIPCFNEAKKQISEEQLKVILKIHVIKFTELFNLHVRLLKYS